ncbi:MAG: sigma-70 family RNA polymerase sigma factor [Ginsengibacter sp.]
MEEQELIPHLFRTEFSKITSVLCKLFGIEYLETAEDIASETFLSALETWSYKGIPANPVAWLYSVAKNKAINQLKRSQLFSKKIAPQIKQSSPAGGEIEIDLSDKNISDSQLQMLFVLCHPSISSEAQIALALRILCGFGIEEIANAFLTNKETINKRLFRAKEILRQGNVSIEFPPEAEINQRLNSALTTLYLLYNEGYYSESSNAVLREDLCTEAMRLTLLLTEYQPYNQPEVYALYSLMCFQSSRFAARKNEKGEIILYHDQDETLWDPKLITKGALFLKLGSTGNKISKYHLEASIAYWHTIKIDSKEKWENILHLYNQLLQIEYSPIAALNRTFALSKVKGKAKAIEEAEKLQLNTNPYYFTLLGELYKDTNRKKAINNFETAFNLAKTNADRLIIKMKIEEILQ